MTPEPVTRPPFPHAVANAAEGLYETGYWLFHQRRTAHALAVFRALVHLAPHDERGWLAVGACYEVQDEHDWALQVYAVGRLRAKPAPLCEVARARILRWRGQPIEARDALARAARFANEQRDDALNALIAREWVKKR